MEKLFELKKHPTRFLSMTSLTVEEFELLNDSFEPHCNNYFFYQTLAGKLRKKITYKEQKNACLKGSEAKLFFLLSYYKNYPLQQFHASYFDISQPKVSLLIPILSSILEKTLKKMGFVPSTDTEQLKAQLEKYQIQEANMDATEREVNRSSDYEVQKEFYSGKKKDIQ